MILKNLKKGGFTLIELMIVVAIIGILAAIAIPNFVRFQARSKQGEAKTNLKALFTAQKSYYGEKDAYLVRGDIIGWTPEQGNRYYYYLTNAPGTVWTRPAAMPANGFDGISQDTTRFPGTLTVDLITGTTVVGPMNGIGAFTTAGVYGTCPSCGFVGVAVGNVDNDTKRDGWAISNADGTTTSAGAGACAAPELVLTSGVPYHIQNDVSCD